MRRFCYLIIFFIFFIFIVSCGKDGDECKKPILEASSQELLSKYSNYPFFKTWGENPLYNCFIVDVVKRSEMPSKYCSLDEYAESRFKKNYKFAIKEKADKWSRYLLICDDTNETIVKVPSYGKNIIYGVSPQEWYLFSSRKYKDPIRYLTDFASINNKTKEKYNQLSFIKKISICNPVLETMNLIGDAFIPAHNWLYTRFFHLPFSVGLVAIKFLGGSPSMAAIVFLILSTLCAVGLFRRVRDLGGWDPGGMATLLLGALFFLSFVSCLNIISPSIELKEGMIKHGFSGFFNQYLSTEYHNYQWQGSSLFVFILLTVLLIIYSILQFAIGNADDDYIKWFPIIVIGFFFVGKKIGYIVIGYLISRIIVDIYTILAPSKQSRNISNHGVYLMAFFYLILTVCSYSLKDGLYDRPILLQILLSCLFVISLWWFLHFLYFVLYLWGKQSNNHTNFFKKIWECIRWGGILLENNVCYITIINTKDIILHILSSCCYFLGLLFPLLLVMGNRFWDITTELWIIFGSFGWLIFIILRFMDRDESLKAFITKHYTEDENMKLMYHSIVFSMVFIVCWGLHRIL